MGGGDAKTKHFFRWYYGAIYLRFLSYPVNDEVSEDAAAAV